MKHTALMAGVVLIILISGCGGGGDPAVSPAPKPVYHHYYGQLHSHSNYSDGTGTPGEAFTHARDVGKADFFALTDHSHMFDHELDWTQSVEWDNLKLIAEDFNEDGKFVAIAGFEMTWSATTGNYGHMNTFNTGWFESRNNPEMNLNNYYQKIAQYPMSISQWNHPGFGDFLDFGYYSPEVDAVIHLIEVGNGDGDPGGNNYYPSYDYYTRALDQGWHVAPTNNQDNHWGEWITANDCRTVVLAESLTREKIFEAIRVYRVYATEDKNLQITFEVNGAPMGTIFCSPTSLQVKITAEDPDPEDQITGMEIISDGGLAIAVKSCVTSNAVWELELPLTKSYYYLKVSNIHGEVAVTAPVWRDQ